MPVVRLEKLLNSGTSGRLKEIIQTAKNSQALTACIQQVLDPEAAAAVLSVTLRDGQLTLLCNSSAWAARLRFESDGILDAARNGGFDASLCRVRVSR